MNTPNFLVRIKGKKISCLGSQFLEILETINIKKELFVWYGSDVEVNGDHPFKFGLQGSIPKKVGTTENMITLAENTDQFLSGVFFALPMDQEKILDREFFTEDDPFRDIGDAVLEIRAFDTSYFEVYSNDFEIIKKLANHFCSKIETHPYMET